MVRHNRNWLTRGIARISEKEGLIGQSGMGTPKLGGSGGMLPLENYEIYNL